jgi:hypothetical protein
MLERNITIKERPEKFQDSTEKFDVIITLEERVFEHVTQGRNMCVGYAIVIIMMFLTTLLTFKSADCYYYG